MIRIRRAAERGHADHGWLDTRHTFSFADYFDPEHVSFRSLRVLNEDRVQPGKGFPSHPHRDMEILTYVLEGSLQHRDSMGNGSVIRPGEIQRMTAGTGVVHSEFNASDTEPVHFLQIWILPEARGLEPGYEQKAFPEGARRGRLYRVASREGGDGAVRVHQDASVYAALLEPGERVEHAPASGRGTWVQVARGKMALNGEHLEAGDGAAVTETPSLTLEGAAAGTEVLVFDLI